MKRKNIHNKRVVLEEKGLVEILVRDLGDNGDDECMVIALVTTGIVAGL